MLKKGEFDMNSIWGSLGGNLIGTLYFLYFQVVGILLIRLLYSKKNTVTHLLCGSVLGSALLQWTPVLFAFFFNFSVTSHILAAVSCGAVLALVLLDKFDRKLLFLPSMTQVKTFLKTHRGFLILFGFTFILFCIMLSSHSFPVKEDGMHTGQCTFGDMNMHLGFITSIARQQDFPPFYSIAPGTKLSWPFLCDSISSSIYIWGSSLRWAYMLPMYFALLQIMLGFYCLAYDWLRKASKACLAWYLFFYNGGLGFVYFIDWSSERTYTLQNMFTGFYETPTNLVGNNIRWVNIIVDMLLPQRATLFGYATLFTCIWLLWRCVYRNEKDLFLLTALLTASLPMVHTHSFLAMAFISAAWLLMYLCRSIRLRLKIQNPGRALMLAFLAFMCILQLLNNKKILESSRLLIIGIAGIGILVCFGVFCLIKHIRLHGYRSLLLTWGLYLMIILCLAFPQLLYWTFGQAANSGFNTGHFNWGNQGDNYLWFYIKNWGVILLLLIPAVCCSKRKNLEILSASFVIWFFIELISISPNTYDNNKLLYVAFIFFCCISADYGLNLYEKLKSLGGARFFGILFLFTAGISGMLSIARELVSDHTLYSKSHLEAALYVDANADTNSTILTNDRHVNEIAALTGRNIVSGASVFLWPHGIYNEERTNDVRTMYEFPESSLELFRQYDVDYVMISSWERSNFAIDESAFDALFECVFAYEEIKLYKTNF